MNARGLSKKIKIKDLKEIKLTVNIPWYYGTLCTMIPEAGTETLGEKAAPGV